MSNERVKVARLLEMTGDPGLGYTHGSPELDADAAKLVALGQDPGPTLEDLDREVAAQAQAEVERRAAAAAQRQRDEDAALADADEIVRRMRARLGRKVCSQGDGRIIREIWERLKAMSGPEVTADSDESFRS